MLIKDDLICQFVDWQEMCWMKDVKVFAPVQRRAELNV